MQHGLARWARSAVRTRLKPISRRDETIAVLKQQQRTRDAELSKIRRALASVTEELESVKEELDQVRDARRSPSFLAQLGSWSRDIDWARRAATDDPRTGMNRKLSMYRFAESHGVAVPQVLGVWQRPEQIDWDALPQACIVKSDGGSSGAGVLPLLRHARGFRLLGQQRVRSGSELSTLLASRARAGQVRGPFFAEEMLGAPSGSDAVRLPDDVKVYTFHGEVGQVLLRRLPAAGRKGRPRWRYLGPDGGDLGAVELARDVDPTVQAPQRFTELVEVARTLSRALPLPFARIDLYDVPEGVRFGEITLTPGGRQCYQHEHDVRMGELWEQAVSRLDAELRGGRPYRIEPGGYPVSTPTRAG